MGTESMSSSTIGVNADSVFAFFAFFTKVVLALRLDFLPDALMTKGVLQSLHLSARLLLARSPHPVQHFVALPRRSTILFTLIILTKTMAQFLHAKVEFDAAITLHPVQILVPPECFVTLLASFAVFFSG